MNILKTIKTIRTIDVPQRTLITNDEGENYILKTNKGWYAKIPLLFNYKQDDLVYIKDNLVAVYNEDSREMIYRKNKIEIWDFVRNKRINEVSIGNNFGHMIYDKRTSTLYITTSMYYQKFMYFITYDVMKNKFNKRKIEEEITTYSLILSGDTEYLFIRVSGGIVRLNVLTLETKTIYSIGKDQEFEIIDIQSNEDKSLFSIAYNVLDNYALVLFNGNNGDVIDKIIISASRLTIAWLDSNFYIVSYESEVVILSFLDVVDTKIIKKDINSINIKLPPFNRFHFISKDFIILTREIVWNVKDNTISKNNKLLFPYIIDRTDLLAADIAEDIMDLKMNYYTLIKGKLVKSGRGFLFHRGTKLNSGKSDVEKVRKLVNKCISCYINNNIRNLIVNFV